MRIPGWKDLGCSPPAWWKKSPLGRSIAHVECPRPLLGRLDGSKVFPQCELKSAFLFSSTHWPCPPDQHVKKASSKESFKWMARSARSEKGNASLVTKSKSRRWEGERRHGTETICLASLVFFLHGGHGNQGLCWLPYCISYTVYEGEEMGVLLQNGGWALQEEKNE